jgi:hypothetical protein
MTMTRSHRRRYEGLGLSLLLSLLFLAGCVFVVYRELAAMLGASKITGSISWVSDFNGVLVARLGLFALSVLLVHASFAVLVWALARLTRAALPERASHLLPRFVVAWAVAITALVLVANASRHGGSRFASADFDLPRTLLGVDAALWITGVLTSVVVALGFAALRRAGPPALPRRRTLGALGFGGLVFAASALVAGQRSEAVIATDRPNVVIIGLDSVRNDLYEVAPGRELTPHVNEFLAGSHRFADTISPLARTFPAWVSILTGRHPVTTNARFNLMPRALMHEGDTLADALRRHGYRSIYATDEVRFANFDASYGFDDLITPPVGASDFVIAAIGDQPLVNLVAGSPLGAWVFPQIHANRGDAITYDPDHFIDRLDREIELQGPGFLAIHLTLAHWPYVRAGQVEPTTPQTWRPAYRDALAAVDLQFQDVLALLGRKGVLENAIVVVLSDHGEALGYPSDSMIRKTGSHLEIWDSLWGHGTSVVSPHQYGVLLAMRAYGRARLPSRPAVHDWPVSLEDVRPTLEELVTGQVAADVDGVSLVPFLREQDQATLLDGRVRFTETCFNTVKMLKGKITKSGVVSEAGIYYEMDADSGWVQLRADRLPEIMARKQRAAISRDALLAAIPSWEDGAVTWIYSDSRTPAPRRLQGVPDPVAEPEAARLWRALQARFPGELGPPGELPHL